MNIENITLEQLKKDLLSNLSKKFNFPPTVKLWTRSNYVEAAKIFSARLRNRNNSLNNCNLSVDNYISCSTLERIFKYGYQLPNPIDKRRLNTLNKLSLCLRYDDFSTYSHELNNNLNVDFKQLILDANIAEFSIYKNLPKLDFTYLLPYFVKNGPAYNQIYKVAHKLFKKQISLKDDKNPSYFEILEVETLKKEKETVRIKTKECWYLKWDSKDENADIKYYNNNNTQLYLLNKTKQGWKINVNHYPFDFNT